MSRVNFVISECLQAPDTEDVSQLDVWSFNLRSCSDELGQFLTSEVVSNGPRTLSQDQLSKLVDLNQCVVKLSNFYEGRLMRFSQVDADTKSGRPKKFINIAMVGEAISWQPNVLVLTICDYHAAQIVNIMWL